MKHVEFTKGFKAVRRNNVISRIEVDMTFLVCLLGHKNKTNLNIFTPCQKGR